MLTTPNYTTLLLLGSFCWILGASPSSAQSYQHIAECTANVNAQSEAMRQDQPAVMVSSTRWFLTNCRDLIRGPDDEAGVLSELGNGLTEQGNFDDAIPILQRCISIKPDAAYCVTSLGYAFQGLGRLTDARSAYERAIAIGGYDQLNASAVAAAHKLLAALPPEAPPPPPTLTRNDTSPSVTEKFGTGFFVSTLGQIVTNNHVVAGCRRLTAGSGEPVTLLRTDENSDLALLKVYDFSKDPDFLKAPPEEQRAYVASFDHAFAKASRADQDTYLNQLTQRRISSQPVAVFRSGPDPQLGDSVVAFGFPLPGVLSSEGNLSTGILSGTSGPGNDARFVQISAPVQPGNSGGPLLDSSGHVIGVVVAKLDALKMAELTGDIPQNVNFAVRGSEVRQFLDEAGVPYQREASRAAMSTRDIAAGAKRITVTIECTE